MNTKLRDKLVARIIEASPHVETAGWWSTLSAAAKKAYKKMHPHSRMGAGSSGGGSAKSDNSEIKQAQSEVDKARDTISKLGAADTRTDAEWKTYDAAQDKLSRATQRLRKLKGK